MQSKLWNRTKIKFAHLGQFAIFLKKYPSTLEETIKAKFNSFSKN
jgi:hypothetical protein